MDEHITLADKSVLENAYVVKLDSSSIAVYLRGTYSFADLYAIFGDKAKTSTMESYQYGETQTWKGYTEVFVINVAEGNTYVNLQKKLKKGE